MSQYRYGKKDAFTKSPSVVARKRTRLDIEVVAEEVGNVRDSMTVIDALLGQISELSSRVYEELDSVNQSVEILEEQL